MLKFFNVVYRIFRCVRECTINFFFALFILLGFTLIGLLNSKPSDEANYAFNGGALVLDLNGYLADNRESYDDFYRLLGNEFANQRSLKYAIFDLANTLRQAKSDTRITGLVLNLDRFQGGDYPALNYIGKQIHAFKESGKPVIAIGTAYSQQQYYLASFADEIYLNKAGAVELTGLKYSNLYFKSLFEKIEAEPYIFRVGTYKSAVEPLIRDEMSAEAKQNMTAWVMPMWENIRQTMAENRKISPEKLVLSPEELLNQRKAFDGNEAEFALKQGLVNGVKTTAEMDQLLAEKFGKSEKNGFKGIAYADYADTIADRFSSKSQNKIAVVNVEGEIVMGESLENTAGADTLVAQLKRVRQDKSVRGVILRINTPGGSALASELIRQEIEAIQKSGIPVVSSMGGMAASGGYWIAATSDAIVAEKNTLTGSIGIFGVMFNLEKTAKNLGVKEDGIATSELAQISPLKPLSKVQSDLIQLSVEQGYKEFINLVSKGRKMPTETADNIAQGQVWLGQKAKELGLVDQLGNFDDAVALLTNDFINKKQQEQNQPKLENLPLQWFDEQDHSLFAEVMRNLNAKIKGNLTAWFDIPFVQKAQDSAEWFNKLNDPKNRYLYCLNCGKIQ